ncbi:MAG TPA: hypothetical protein VMW00_00825 [Dehalococcoidales bacterium]|nr:hypothetical protein [Dehalococcoidales bacterium]
MASIKSPGRLYTCVIALGVIFLLSLSLSIPASPATASPDEAKWSRVNIPAQGRASNWVLADGSDIQHLTMAIDGTIYACGKGLSFTLYKSTDGGYSWEYIGDVQDSIVDIATAPNDANAIYYATASDVYRSTDGGKKFYQMAPNPGGAGSNNIAITAIDVTQMDSAIVAVGTRDTDNSEFGGIYILDEEQVIPSWQDTSPGNYDVYAVAFSPDYAADRQLVAVVTDETDTLVTTKFGGAGWGATIGDASLDKDNSGIPTPVAVANQAAITFPDDYDATSEAYIQFIAIDTGSDEGDVYKIRAVAAPGSSVATDLDIGYTYGLDNVDVTGLAITGSGTTASLMAGSAASAQTYFSDDGGKNWTRSRKEPTGGSQTYVLMAPDFTSSDRAYTATSGSDSAFSVSQDSGDVWNQVSLIDTEISTIVDLAPSPDYNHDNTLFMLTLGGDYSLWRSLNGGTMWERVFASTLTNVDSLELVKLSPQYGNSRQTVFIAGSSNSRPAIWKSTDNGQTFKRRLTFDPDSGSQFPINTWAIANDTTLLIGSYDGSNGLVYSTADGGFSYSSGAAVGNQSLNSLVLSPNYEQDETILIGNTSGWVYWSSDNGTSFEPLPTDATSPPLAGFITIAFDPKFGSNNTVYAASSTADKGIYRFIIGKSTEWESIDSTLPSGSTLNQLLVSADGTLYAANFETDAGMERCLDPTYSLGPVFETVTRGLADGATLSGLWLHDHRLWATNSANTKLVTFTDSLTSPIVLTSPSNSTTGAGTLVNYTISNINLDWEAVSGATSYQWQLDYDTDFSAVPSDFEGNTKASSVRLPTLEPATTYYWRVRVAEPVLSPWSAKWSFATSLDTESVAIKLESPKAGATGVATKPLFQWSSVAGADAYELLLSADVNFANPSIIKTGTYALPSTAWQCNLSLNHDTTYYWKVRAINSDTQSAWSAVGAFATNSAPIPPAPTTVPPAVISPVPVPLPVMPTMPSPPPAPVSPPLPPPPATESPDQTPITPDWVIYLIGALLLTIILLAVIVLVLASGMRRS